MDKESWEQLTTNEKSNELKTLLRSLITLDKTQKQLSRTGTITNNKQKYKLEQEVLKYISWEKQSEELT